jgi:hypothetical protein
MPDMPYCDPSAGAADVRRDPMAVFPRDGYTLLIYAAREDADAVAAHYRATGARVETPDVWSVEVYGLSEGARSDDDHAV